MVVKSKTISETLNREDMHTHQLMILIIDDSKLIRERLKEILSQVEGIECIDEAKYAHEGLNLVILHKPDIVFLDFKLHDRIGIDIVEKIKLLNPHSIIVVLTNYTYSVYRARCMSVGADYFLDKSHEFGMVRNITEKIITKGCRKGTIRGNIYNKNKAIINLGNRYKPVTRSMHTVRKGH